MLAVTAMLRRPFFMLLSSSLAIGCGSPNYGAPTDSTIIDLKESDGFSGRPDAIGVHIEGTTATYHVLATTAQATIAVGDVAAIIHALEGIEFLSLGPDYTMCKLSAYDAPIVTFAVSLSAGANTLVDNQGCLGGIFDELVNLDVRIRDLSGFTAWFAAR